MVLLHVLHALRAQFGWRLTVAHLNHQLRGNVSDADEEFVEEVARRLGLGFRSERSDVAAHARNNKLSIEMAARKLRHDFLARTADRLRIRSVALAHHADDRVELFFLRLLRGAGGAGLAGIKWSNSSPNDPKIQLVRPLLDQSKAALRDFATEREVAFREDSTNASLNILRNRVRHKLLPLLTRDYQPALATTTLRAMEILGAETDFVNGAAQEWLRAGPRLPFDRLHMAVQRHVIRLQLMELGIAPDFELVEQLRVVVDKWVSIAPLLSVSRDKQGLVRTSNVAESRFGSAELSAEFHGGNGEIVFGRLTVRWQVQACNRRTSGWPRFRTGCEYFDAGKVGSSIVLRHWRPGDRFQPVGMPQAVKLQDLFTSRKISRSRRHELVVAATERGELFWVEGLRISAPFILTGHTRRRLVWKWLRESEVAGGGRP